MTNRERIMQEALTLMAQRGYEAVGVQEVVEAAEVTKPTLYHYFGSKQGLLEAVCAEWGDRLMAAVGPAARYQGDLPVTLFRLAMAYADFAKQDPEFYRLMLATWFAPPGSTPQAVIQPCLQRQQERLETLFMAAAQDHGNMKGRHRLYAATFLGLINTLVGASLNGHVELSQEVVFQAVHQYMHGIYS